MNKPMIDTSLIVDCLTAYIDTYTGAHEASDERHDHIALVEAQIAYLLEPDPILSMDAVRKLGALQVEYERSQGVDEFLHQQRMTYGRHKREDLEEELLRRDRTLITEGRNLGNQKMTGNLLRELMRGILVQADLSALKQISADAKGGNIIGILEALGAAPADKRQLRLMGTTLGDMSKTTEEREAEMLALAAGTLAHTDDTTAGSARVGDAIREHRKEQVPEPAPPSVPPASNATYAQAYDGARSRAKRRALAAGITDEGAERVAGQLMAEWSPTLSTEEWTAKILTGIEQLKYHP